MLDESLTLMLVGMGTVCIFLSLMVVILHFSASFFSSWPEDESANTSKKTQKDDDQLIEIAIALAAIERSEA